MITNLDEPKYRELRQRICFRDPSHLFYFDDKKGEFRPTHENYEISKYDFKCSICWETLIDPKKCDRCSIKFCHRCRVEQTRFFIGCPSYKCSDSACSRPNESDTFMRIYDRLYLKCSNKGCSKFFTMA